MVITFTILNLFLMERVRIILGHFKNPSIAIVRNLSRNFNYLPLCRGPRFGLSSLDQLMSRELFIGSR